MIVVAAPLKMCFELRLTVGGSAANHLAAWDGSSWSPLGSGVNDAVRALALHEGELIAAGAFSRAGAQVAAYVTRWTKHASSNSALPRLPVLAQNVPNPFNPQTRIDFALPRASHISLRVYNSQGRLVRTVASGNFDAGTHTVRWDGRDERGAAVGSGAFFYRIDAGSWSSVKKMLLLKWRCWRPSWSGVQGKKDEKVDAPTRDRVGQRTRKLGTTP